jgi:hypothetical protein
LLQQAPPSVLRRIFRMALPLNFETAAQEIRGVLKDFLNPLVARDNP